MSAIKNKWEKTGIFAVDMVTACVSHYRHFNKPLKTIYLRPVSFYQFLSFVNGILEKKEELVDESSKLEFDSVDIKMGSKLQTEEIYCEFYNEVVLN
jgi:hypothetical protein